MINNSTCSWLPVQTDCSPCTPPILLACCLPRFSLCLSDFMPGAAFTRSGTVCLLSLGAEEETPCLRHDLAMAKSKRPQPTRHGSIPGRVQHAKSSSCAGTGGISTADSSSCMGQAGFSTTDSSAAQDLPSASAPPGSRTRSSRNTRFKGHFHWLCHHFILPT